ncbi:MAG: M42 family metallopeptidase [Erysipelotrichaceae bacterium]
MNINLMRELTEALGIGADEKDVSRILKREYLKYSQEIIYDNLGSIAVVKRSKTKNAPKVMLLGHMDEVGMMVTKITDTGCLEFCPVGGLWNQNLLAQRVIVRATEDISGVIGSIPPHLLTPELRMKPMSLDNMLVDCGFTSKDEALKAGVRVGCSIIVEGSFKLLNNGKRLLAKAWDNRFGCLLGVELLAKLKDVELPFDLYIGASSQEEVGIRGAKTLTNLIDPDLAIIADCSPANDASGEKKTFGQLGKGPLVRVIDRNYLPNRALIDLWESTLKDNDIPYQYYLSLGGTDAGEVHKSRNGVLTLTSCICARNIHSNSSIIDADDYSNAIKGLDLFLRKLNRELIDEIKQENR